MSNKVMSSASGAIVWRVKRAGFTIPIDLIIELILALIEECFPTQSAFVDAAKDPSFFQMLVLRRRASRALPSSFRGPRRRRAAYALTDAILREAEAASDETLAAVYNSSE